MGLRAFLFEGDAKLEAALVEDRAHILEGAQGDHVAKIQTAVIMLDGADIDDSELTRKFYGPSTSRAVLKFKTSRKIINASYQNTADAIVGKMTVRALDDEVAEIQDAPDSGVGDAENCTDNSVKLSPLAKLRLADLNRRRSRAKAFG